MALASRFCCCITYPPRARILPLSDAVASWNSLERDLGGGGGDDFGVGQESDLEGEACNCRAQAEGIPKGGDASQEDRAGGEARLERHPAWPKWDILIYLA